GVRLDEDRARTKQHPVLVVVVVDGRQVEADAVLVTAHVAVDGTCDIAVTDIEAVGDLDALTERHVGLAVAGVVIGGGRFVGIDHAVADVRLRTALDDIGRDRAGDRLGVSLAAVHRTAAVGFGGAVGGGADGRVLDGGEDDVAAGGVYGRLVDEGIDATAHVVDHHHAAGGDGV